MHHFLSMLCLFLAACHKSEKCEEQHTVRVNISSDAASLDPRNARDLSSSILVRMLFEGLMRSSDTGSVIPAIAKSVEVAEDGLKYIFLLRDTQWSDGKPVKASDFVYAWKSLLNPTFLTDIAQYLYPIKNAREAKLGLVSLEEVGVKALDDATLVVELHTPTPYFLELLTTSAFFAVPEHVVLQNPYQFSSPSMVSNGPFQMAKWKHADQISLKKNALYWQAKDVSIERLDFIIASPDTALRMFEEGKLDWIGSPLSLIPIDAAKSLKQEHRFCSAPFLATSFCRVNTLETMKLKKNPLSNRLFRQALALSLNRFAIVEELLQGGQKAALRLVPPEMSISSGYFPDFDIEKAQECLALAREEWGEDFDSISLSYYNNERNALIAQTLQKQWMDALGIDVVLDAVEQKSYFQRISNKDFQLGLGSWTADFNDPINFLEIFKFKDNGMNSTSWENAEYIDLLNRSAICKDLVERKAVLHQAEEILMHDMPLIPIYHFALNYVKNERLQGVTLSPQGHLDFRRAFFKEI